MKIIFIRSLRGVVGIGLIALACYFFIPNFTAWYTEGFPIFSSGAKGKNALSGIFFSIIFFLYGGWEISNAIKKT